MSSDPEKEHPVVVVYRRTPMVVRMLFCSILILLFALAGLIVWKWFSQSSTKLSVPREPVETGTVDFQQRSVGSVVSDTDMNAIQKEIMSFTAKFVR